MTLWPHLYQGFKLSGSIWNWSLIIKSILENKIFEPKSYFRTFFQKYFFVVYQLRWVSQSPFWTTCQHSYVLGRIPRKWKPGHLENPWIKTEIGEGNRVRHYLDLSFKTFLISNFRLDRHWLRLALTATEWD